MFHKCKIKVVKRECNVDLIRSYVRNPQHVKTCKTVRDNQEFIVSNPYEMPDGMCAYAWADIRPQILAVAAGSTFEFLKDENSAMATCTDLFRPVIFKIERMQE